jgi:membrane-bound lytic murein transglycosylase D
MISTKMYITKIFFLAKWLLTTIIIFCIFTNASAASARRVVEDTSKKSIAAIPKVEEVKNSTAANVVYPQILIGNEDEANSYIEKFAENRRDYLIRMYKRGKSFFPKITKTFKRYNLPHELKVLIALESAFNGNATSHAGAVGYWQIMDEVAQEYGLRYIPQPTAEEKKIAAKNKGLKIPDTVAVKKPTIKDERKNFHKSTHAAARYLRDRYRNLGNNTLLVVASYNCGVGNVWEAIRKSGKPNASFWDIKTHLPAETRNYVMNFIALNVIYHNYDKFLSGSLRFKGE